MTAEQDADYVEFASIVVIEAWRIAGDLETLSQAVDCKRSHLMAYGAGSAVMPEATLRALMEYLKREKAKSGEAVDKPMRTLLKRKRTDGS
jgi:hypothetical protein